MPGMKKKPKAKTKKLTPRQKRFLDKDKDGKITKKDFKMIRKKKSKKRK